VPNFVAWRSFFGFSMMVIFSLFPGGVLQVSDVVQHGCWHARGLDYFGSGRSHLIEWLRLPGDLVFIVFVATPLVIASIKGNLGVRTYAALGSAHISNRYFGGNRYVRPIDSSS
jgi:nitric oxide reductase subunit B